MDPARRHPWIRAALLAAIAYVIIGVLFALPKQNVHFWRLAAWLASGIVFAAQMGHEELRRRSAPLAAAWHAALAAGVGALGLAVVAIVHEASTRATIRPAWRLALVLWPLITAVPAFVVAFAAAFLLARVHPPELDRNASRDAHCL